MPNWKKVITSGSNAELNQITGSTLTVVSSSLDHVLVNDRLQGNGSGFQFFAYNEDTVKTKFANWYSSNDRQYGMGQLWFETWFAAIDNQAARDNRRIGFYLEEPDAGSTDSGTPGQHPSNARFYVDINGAYLSGSLNVTNNVGIGTTSPISDLHIADGFPRITLQDTDGSNTRGFIDYSGDYLGFISQNGSSHGNIRFSRYNGTSTVDSMYIDSSGNVGINKTPTTEKLEVNGAIVWEGPLTTSQTSAGVLDRSGDDLRIRAYGATAGSGQLVFRTGGGGGSVDSERMRIDSSGNVGIGTTSVDSTGYVNLETAKNIRIDVGDANADPVLYFSHDNFSSATSNYITLNRADESMRFNVNDAERMRIDSSGNVGIGTTSPSAKLDISFSGGSDSIKSTSTNSTSYNGSKFYNDNSKGWHDLVYGSAYSGGSLLNIGADGAITYANTIGGLTTVGAFDLLLGTNSTERMRITSGGNVGIGTTSPDTTLHTFGTGDVAKFETTTLGGVNFSRENAVGNNSTHFVNSFNNADSEVAYIKTLNRTGATTSTGTGYELQLAVAGSGYQTFYTNGSERMRIDSSGITSVYNDFIIDNSSPEMYFQTGPTHYRWMIAAQENADGAFEITPSTTVGGSTYSTPVAVFKATGNVGIGTTSPTAKLEVFGGSGTATYDLFRGYAWNGTANKRLDIQLDNTEADSLVIYNATKSGGASVSHTFQVDSSEKMRIDSSGNVGINETNPSTAKLVIETGPTSGIDLYRSAVNAQFEAFRFRDSTNANTEASIGWGADQLRLNSTNNTVFTTAGTERMRIDSSGNVGIGTTSPGVKLDVSGAIRATGDITAFYSSDRRLKDNIKPIENATEKIKKIGGYEFDWKPNDNPEMIHEGHDIGVIAQEVEAVLPEIVKDRDDGYKAVEYQKLVALLIESNKELAARVEELEKKLN